MTDGTDQVDDEYKKYSSRVMLMVKETIEHNSANDLIQLMSRIGINKDVRDKDGCTMLMFAANSNKVNIVKVLLASGANPNLRAHDGTTPLHMASSFNHLDVVRALIEGRARVDEEASGFTPLGFAAENGHLEVVKELLRAGARPKGELDELRPRDPVCLAAQGGHVDVVRVLIEAGARVDQLEGHTALSRAAIFNQPRAMAELLKNGASITMSKQCCGARENRECYPPLHCASRRSNHKCVAVLLAYGARETARDCQGRTPIQVVGHGMPTEGGDKDGESGEESTDETPEERESRHAATLWIMMSLVRGPAVRARSWCWPVVAAASPESCENVCQRRGSSQGVLLPVTDWVRGRTKRMVIAIGGKAPNSSRGARARELDDRFVVNAMYRYAVKDKFALSKAYMGLLIAAAAAGDRKRAARK